MRLRRCDAASVFGNMLSQTGLKQVVVYVSREFVRMRKC